MKKIIKRILKDLFVGIIGTLAILGIFFILGQLVALCETYFIARLVLYIVGIYTIIKFVIE